MRNWSLRKIFLSISILIGIVPSVISTYFLKEQIKTINSSRELNISLRKERIRSSIEITLKEIQSSIQILRNSPELIEYFRTPEKFRVHIENQIVGKIYHLIKSTEDLDNIRLLDKNKKILINLGSEKPEKFIYFKTPIFLDDQNLPSSRLYGIIETFIDVSKIQSKYPSLLSLSFPKASSYKNFIIELKPYEESDLRKLIILNISILIISIMIGLFIIRITIIKPIQSMTNILDINNELKEDLNANEITLLKSLIEKYKSLVKTKEKEKAERVRIQALASQASQVAHDIKSPLAALEIVLEDIKSLPEDSRELTLHAISRIKDIATNLTKSYESEDLVKEFLPFVSIENLINEKFIEYQQYKELILSHKSNETEFTFLNMDESKFLRTLSNVINNSAEAVNYKGTIRLTTLQDNNYFIVRITDDGPGFPEKILNNSFEKGLSINKKGGQGLGLYSSYQFLKQIGGSISISNDGSSGAIVQINFPIYETPSWFCSKLDLRSIKIINIIDDDKSIHNVWDKLLKQTSIKIYDYYSSDEIKKEDIESSTSLNLIDYDLRENQTGIDLIKKYSLKNSILVTSNYDEKYVTEYCSKNEIKLIPKQIVTKIKIEY